MTGPLIGQADELLPVRVSPGWLTLREPADAAARASDLVEQVRHHLPAGQRTVIHDLGCGTGSMGRWLAPRLTGEQHWVMYDRDVELLDRAAAGLPRSADGVAVTVETRQRDITRLEPADLAGASLITASALLDMLTADELHRFVRVWPYRLEFRSGWDQRWSRRCECKYQWSSRHYFAKVPFGSPLRDRLRTHSTAGSGVIQAWDVDPSDAWPDGRI